MKARTERLIWPSLAVAASGLFWGTMWIPLRKVAAPGIPPSWSAVLVYAVPALLVLPIIAYRWRAIGRGGWALLMVGLGVGACNALYAVALTIGEVSMIVLLFYLNPIWATLMERMVLGTPIVGFRWFSVGLGITGMVALQGLAGRWPFPANIPEWMGLGAGFCWAVGLVATNVARESSVLDKTTLQFFCASVFGVVILLALDFHGAWPSAAGIAATLPWVLATAAFWIVPAMGLSLWGASRMSPGRASMLLMLEVVVAVGTAAWIAGEELGTNKLIGGALIMSASLVDAWSSARSDRRLEALSVGDRA